MDDEYRKLFQLMWATVRELRAQLNSLESTIRFLELKVQEPKNEIPSIEAYPSPRRVDKLKTEPHEPTRTINLQSTTTIGSRRQAQYHQSNLQPFTEQGAVAEFNALAKQSGRDFKTAKDDFIKKHNVRAFRCTNFEARMNEPIPAPSFVEATSTYSGEYWAIPLGGNSFAVVPNVRTYSDNYHAERAMGEVFDSNFTAGSTYSYITVEQPAVFDCSETTWFLRRKGRLRLG